jgi:N-acetyl-D-muramate 6-phosphate phosphatase
MTNKHPLLDAVLFDLDGTLIDSAMDLGAAAEKMRTQRGLPLLGLAAYRHMAGAGARGMLGIALDVAPNDPGYEALKGEFLANYEAALSVHTQAFDGVAELLMQLGVRGLSWGIVTNKAERFALPLVQCLPVLSTAAVVIGGDTTPHPKPHPAPLLEAAARLGVAPARCLYVGDDLRDVVAGRAAGMKTVAARYGYLGAVSDTEQWGADYFIDQPLSLLKILDLA